MTKEAGRDPFDGEKGFISLPKGNTIYAALGQVASAWAYFEFSLDRCICDLMGADEEQMVCVTAQLMSVWPRFRAYTALADLRGTPPEIVDRINSFAGQTDPLTQKRNRAIHDTWVMGVATQQVGQIRATANKKLDYGLRPGSAEELEALCVAIGKRAEEFSKLHNEVAAHIRLTPPQDCPDCNATGRIPAGTFCKRCKGSGKLPNPIRPQPQQKAGSAKTNKKVSARPKKW